MSFWDNILTRINQWAVGQPQNSYEAGGTSGRRVKGWNAPASGPRSTLNRNLATLRNRSRDQIRNNGRMAHAVTALVTNEIGTGIIPRSRTQNETLRENINQLWRRSEGELDADGVLNIYGLQALASRTRRVAGEVFIRRRRRRGSDGLHVPMQVQVLEPEFVPLGKNEKLPNGNEICAGIEFDRRGRRVAYWMHREHPGDGSGGFNANQLIRVLASDVIHHFMPLRPGQIRGEPDTVSALLSARDLHEYQDAELVRKKTRAPFTGFLERQAIDYGDDVDPLTGLPQDAEEPPELNVAPGSIITGIPGESLHLFEGDDAGNGYADYMRQQLLDQATAMNLPYEIFSGDWQGVNDRLVRVILNEFHRYIESVQDHYMIYQVCARIWSWWLDAAVLSRALLVRSYATQRDNVQLCEWRPQGWPYIHPVQDVDAKLKAISGGLTSRQAEVAKSGWDVEEIDEQNREDQERSSGLNYSIYSDDSEEEFADEEFDE